LTALVSLGLVETASAYYDPRTGRFISRDPIHEPGAMLVRHGRAFIQRDGSEAGGSNRYAYVFNAPIQNIDPLGEQCGGALQDALRKCGDDYAKCNFKCELGNRFIWNYWDRKKCLANCDSKHYACVRGAFPDTINPLPANSPECDKYKCDDEYTNTSARCFCKCAGDSPWSNHVRGCLRQMYEAGACPEEAHAACYLLGDKESGGDMPVGTLAWCFAKCFDYNPFD